MLLLSMRLSDVSLYAALHSGATRDTCTVRLLHSVLLSNVSLYVALHSDVILNMLAALYAVRTYFTLGCATFSCDPEHACSSLCGFQTFSLYAALHSGAIMNTLAALRRFTLRCATFRYRYIRP